MRFSVAILITIIVCKRETSAQVDEKEREHIQDNNEAAQTDDNCLHSFSNLTINPSSEELNITWDADTSEKCNFQYKINIVLPQTKRTVQPKIINTTYYLLKVIPCTKYNVTVELLQNGNSSNLKSLTDSYETEPIAFNQIEKLNISTTTSAIWLSWRAHKHAHVCKIRYIITANKEIPYFRYVNRTEHWIKNLHSCTEYNVSVTPSSRLRSEFDDETPHLMHQITTLPEKVKNLNLEVQSNNISMITWIPPDNNKCIKEYKITINGTASNTPNTSLDSSDNLYCTEIGIEPVNNNNTVGESVRIKKPGPVKNLTTTSTKNSITATWEQPENGDCVKDYLVQLVGTKEIVENLLYYTFDNLQSCSEFEIKVAARSSDGTPGEYTSVIESTSKPEQLGPVKNLITEATATSITASWERPENDGCVNDYLIKLVGFNESYTDSLIYTFDNLQSCSEFEIKVAARSSDGTPGEYTSVNESTSEPTNIGHVEEFKVNDNNNVVTWKHPLNTDACGITYVLRVCDNKNNEIDKNSTTETFLQIGFDSWVGCMRYTISITPTLHLSEGKTTEEPIKFSRVTNSPTCEGREVHNTSAVFECGLDNYEINMCTINKICIHCEASDENIGSWIIWNATASQDIKDDDRQPITVTVKNISEFTHYNCYGVVHNSAGNSSESKPVPFQTKEGVPDAPHLDEITPTDKILHIQWRKPEKIPGIQQNYSIQINSLGPKYFVPNDEQCKPRGKKFYTYSVEPSENQFDFTEAFPSYKYEVYIKASTQAGFGPEAKTETETDPAIPDEPRNIDFTIVNNNSTKDYQANVTFTWMYPCYTNGEMQHFEVDILGIPYADLKKENHTKNHNVTIHEEKNIVNYKYTIIGLSAAFNYTVYIKTVLENNFKSDQPPLNFSSPEGYPQAPVINREPKVEENAFTLEWHEPPEKNGTIQYYNVTVKTEGSLYKVPPNCPREKPLIKSYKIPPNNRSFKFDTATAYHSYTAIISASTRIGEGETSEQLSIETLPTKPEQVRDFHAIATNTTTVEYNAQVYVSFKHPCNIYGSFKQFTITLCGNRYNHSHRVEKVETGEKEKYEVMFDLRAEYKYVLTVQVETENDSTRNEEKFTSSSGVPPTVSKNMQAPVPHGSTQANFTFDCNLFDDKYGTIIYYALILGENNYEENHYGFWNGNSDTWPSVNNTFAEHMQMQPYQATPNLWNPFKNCGCCNYTFVLGDDSYSELNKPLQDGITYTFKVRGFTQNGYRDSPTITFLIPALTNLALILGLLFGLLGTGILLGFIFILWRRRKQWQMKKDSIKSIPATPIPVSIKQFSQYYSELRSNSDRLKQEFLFLGNKSGALPSYDGMLPENRKKNRYTNIIPYDETRVKLMDTNDNYSVTDYINASFVQGYSGAMEYIATQGPLEHTCMDFWKMVIQENSSLIVMVAQFVEQNKDKCYKYFPNNHENMELENGIAIRCCTELDFKTHIVRTLLIQRDLQQWTVTHLQFMEWPDFGCPTGTDVILEFCQIMREHAERNSDPIVIHCSAGVGRTGTLIALDIVLQAISYKRDIDIFGTVLNLRKDRKSMVQTEKQYLYIHTCVKDAIENPLPVLCADILKEPVYENLEDFNRSQSDDNIKESQF